MKKILFMIMTVLGWINLTSCNDYLEFGYCSQREQNSYYLG